MMYSSDDHCALLYLIISLGMAIKERSAMNPGVLVFTIVACCLMNYYLLIYPFTNRKKKLNKYINEKRGEILKRKIPECFF